MFVVQNASGDKLAFYDVPKNASTTIKKLFIDHLGISDQFDFYGEEFIDDSGNRIGNFDNSKKYKTDKSGLKKDFHEFAQNTAFHALEAENNLSKVCVVRDPLERFVSCFNHIVLVNKEFSATPYEALESVRTGTQKTNHLLPQAVWLGKNDRYYDKIYNVNQVSDFCTDLNSFFGKNVDALRYQTAGSSVEFPIEVDQALKDKVREVYSLDYKTFGKYF